MGPVPSSGYCLNNLYLSKGRRRHCIIMAPMRAFVTTPHTRQTVEPLEHWRTAKNRGAGLWRVTEAGSRGELGLKSGFGSKQGGRHESRTGGMLAKASGAISIIQIILKHSTT